MADIKDKLDLTDGIVVGVSDLVSEKDLKFLQNLFFVYGFAVDIPDDGALLLEKVGFVVDRVVDDICNIQNSKLRFKLNTTYLRAIKILWTLRAIYPHESIVPKL